jgi:ADP-ribose pyrophosphatase
MNFQLGDKRILFEGKFLSLWGRDFIDKGGKSQIWEYVEKADVISVLPITDDGKAVLVKNYRVPLEGYVIEPPAGLTDKDGESYEEAIKRELLEETGYRASKLYALPPYPYRSGTSGNMIYGFIATGLTKITDVVGDDTEDISVMEVPLKELVNLWLNPTDGIYFQPEILAMYQAALTLGIVKG